MRGAKTPRQNDRPRENRRFLLAASNYMACLSVCRETATSIFFGGTTFEVLAGSWERRSDDV